MKTAWAIHIAILLLSATVLLTTAAPANDSFVGRPAIAGMTNTIVGSNVGATKEFGEPDHAGNPGGRSIWWRWTPLVSGAVTLNTDGSSFDTTLAIYRGSELTNLVTVAADNDSGAGSASQVQFNAAAGNGYQIAVDGFGSAAGSVVLNIRQVFSLMPQIDLQPQSQVVLAGRNATFTANASGSGTLSYQWRKNGTNLIGATNTSFTLTNVQAAHAGPYSVLVSNALGSETSSNAILNVTQPVALVPATDAPGLVWTTGGSSLWTGQTNVTHDGVSAAQSGAIGGSQDSWLQTVVTGPGTLSFWWKVVSLEDGDFFPGDNLEFYINGTRTNRLTGDVDWRLQAYLLPAGSHTLRWRYVKDMFGERGQDAGWLDQVAFGLRPPVITNQPSAKAIASGETATFTVAVLGRPPLTYQWQFNGTDIPGATNAVFLRSNATTNQAGAYRVLVSNVDGTTASIPANLRVSPAIGLSFTAGLPGYFSGSAYDLEVVGNLAYVSLVNAGIGGLAIVDISNPAQPRRVGGYTSPENAWSIAVANNLVYLGEGGEGFEILDVRNPANPFRVGGYRTSVSDLDVEGHYVFVASGDGLKIVDVSYVPNPYQVGAFSTNGWAYGLDVVGTLAYVAYGPAGLQIVDVSNPANPVRVGGYSTSGAMSVQTVGRYAYLASGSAGGLEIIDVINPANPVRVGGYDTIGQAAKVQVVGSLAYVADDWGGLQVIDVSNPASPVPVGAYDTKGWARAVQLAGSYACVAADWAGLQLIDVTTPSKPSETGSFQSYWNVEQVAVMGNHAYLASASAGLQVIDLSDPGNPQRIGSHENTDTNGWAYGVTLAGHHAYVADGDAGLLILDVSNPAQPRRLGAHNAGGIARDVKVRGNYAYVAALNGGLEVIDVSNPASPFLAGRSATNTYAYSVDVVGNYAYVGAFYEGFQILDVSDPANPARVGGTLRVSGGCIHVAGRYAYVGTPDGFDVVDVANPLNPVRVSQQVLGGYGYGIRTAGRYAIVAADDAGLQIFDMIDPVNPLRVGKFDGLDFRSVDVVGNVVCAAQSAQGLTLLDLGASFASAPTLMSEPASRRVLRGATTTFNMSARGTIPLAYQWRHNGTNLPGATAPALTLSNIQSSQVGLYSVSVSNAVGTQTSSNAILGVDFPPLLAITNPTPEAAYYYPPSPPTQPPPINITVQAEATDSDGTVTQVSFFAGTTLLGVDTNAPFAQTWANVPAGTHVLTARAIDNEGAATTSAPVRITVTNVPVFQLSRSAYLVNETNGTVTGTVTVTIRRNTTGVASVNYFTANGTARAVVNGGIGSYTAVSNRLTFAAGELSRDIPIAIANDLVNRGERNFLFQLSAPSSGWFLASPSNAVVTILDDDPLTNNVLTDVVSAGPAPGRGSLQVTLTPAGAQGRWRLWWEDDWRASGSTISNLAAGEHRIQFMPRQGYRPPGEWTLTITQGLHHAVTTNYTIDGIINPPRGALTFSLLPGSVATATNLAARGQWRLPAYADTNWRNSGEVLSNIPAGAHWAEFKPISGGSLPPAPQLVLVAAGTLVTYEAGYRTSQASPPNGPRVLDSFRTITNEFVPGTPYQFGGQLLSDAGAGSGFAVRPKTVLTAAHVVFDSARLTYSSNLWWFFQRHAGDYEPVPLEPRGSYLFEGYAARRAQDQAMGLNPSESSFESRVLDAAALFFFTNAARGGYSGYLTATESADWLGSSGLKMLIGYPVEGVAETNRGRMHEAGPVFASLDRISSDDPVYRTDQMVSFPGNSGGPVCVFSTDSRGRPYFIPAGIFLGGDGEIVVRAIDVDVVDLINRAERSGGGGGNSTGGGVVPVQLLVGSSFRRPGYLSISLGPPAARRLGGDWRISPTNSGGLTSYTDYNPNRPNPYLLPVASTNFSIEAKGLAGFSVSLPGPIVLAEGTTQKVEFTYQVNPPRLVFRPPNGLGLTGTVGTTYSIERSPALPGTWTSAEMITLLTGTNWIPGTAPTPGSTNRFHRAKWIIE